MEPVLNTENDRVHPLAPIKYLKKKKKQSCPQGKNIYFFANCRESIRREKKTVKRLRVIEKGNLSGSREPSCRLIFPTSAFRYLLLSYEIRMCHLPT